MNTALQAATRLLTFTTALWLLQDSEVAVGAWDQTIIPSTGRKAKGQYEQ